MRDFASAGVFLLAATYFAIKKRPSGADMYAIIEEGSKQFKVTTGDTLLIDRKVEEGTTSLKLDRVLLVGGAGETKVGQPLVAGATVSVDVLGDIKGPKVISYDYKRRKGYRNTKGHRQQYTKVKVTAINA
jgi:large subunit ribosomal protein L21